ncbi:MAG TPA: sulfotransferase [Rhizomicrobium sp.]|jgi:tetratricopeptide (TPR) repeat protein|nr:sulfotransferase [Rhizomicrobium sp.]
MQPDVATKRPDLRNAALLARQGQFEPAAALLRQFLGSHPDDADAFFLLGDIMGRQRRFAEAEPLLAWCVELKPNFDAARFHHANALLEIGQAKQALTQAQELLQHEPHNPVFRALKAMALELADDHGAAALLWHGVVQEGAPAEFCVRYSHVLRVLGRREDSIAACREAIARDFAYGRAWWALATLSTFRFTDEDIAQMEAQVVRPDISPEDRVPFLFALGKAHAQRKQYEKSFAAYARGNALKRLNIRHDPSVLTAYVARCKGVFTEESFRARQGAGHDSSAPIFLVGMTRAGSTLVEQILSSHSQVEGTRELFNLGAIAGELQRANGPSAYPAMLETMDGAMIRQFGEQYLETARIHRKLGRPHFIDKMGNNFVHLGLLHLILPNAKIVDVRRNPLACGWSNFSQLYANGQNETYRLSDFGQLYCDYAHLMAHFDSVLPGRVYRLCYERLVANPEGEIRRLLDHLELPFEEACLEFHKNERAVSTISSEQVRSPLYTEALDYWRHYEPWLGPLKGALGPVASDWEGR